MELLLGSDTKFGSGGYQSIEYNRLTQSSVLELEVYVCRNSRNSSSLSFSPLSLIIIGTIHCIHLKTDSVNSERVVSCNDELMD